jgi:hypothetical protein
MSVHDVCMYAYVYNNINKEKKKEKQTQEKIYEDTGYTFVNVVYMCKKYKNTHVCIYI